MSVQTGSAAYIADMMSEQAQEDPSLGPSEVADFYAGCNVLITGGSGFMGKLLVEKILRSCPDVGKLFFLLRAKKGKSTQMRFKEQFEDTIFDKLKREQPGFARRVIMVEGDVGEEGLGLSPENRQLLRDSHIVIHGAATVRFDEKLRVAVNINVRGTKELLLFAKEMTNLKAFVHISTAYSQCVRKDIDEKFYPPPMDGDKLISLVDMLDDSTLNHMTPVLIGKWPNTYAFTKATAEDIVRRHSSGIPVAIVRPSIVIATAKEPIAGWINNLYGPTGVVMGAGVGLLRTLHCDKDIVADIIPADYVINNIIVAAWDIARTKSINPNSLDFLLEGGDTEIDEPPIFNSVSSCQKPITWGQFMKLNEEYGMEVPCAVAIWCYFFTLNKHLWLHNVYVFFLHDIPAIILDSLAFMVGRKPALMEAYRKIHKFSAVISYFCTQQWHFHNEGVLKLWKKLGPADRVKFDFNLDSLNWEDYFYNHIRGLRVYIAKDPLDTVPQGKAKYAKFRIAHITLTTVLIGLLLWAVIIFLRLLGLW